MRLITSHQGQLVSLDAASSTWNAAEGSVARARPVWTGWRAMDDLLPPGGLARGAVHEVLHRPGWPEGRGFALAVAKRISNCRFPIANLQEAGLGFLSIGNRQLAIGNVVVWFDPDRTLYPPAVFQAGVDPRDLWIVYPRDEQELLWGLAECLRCRGVAATIAPVPARLDRIDARRLQLAAERGGGVGLFLRPLDKGSDVYAAATRWLVEPARGERTVQRWRITLHHGHGGQVGKSFLLEKSRENHLVRAVAELAGGSGDAPAAGARIA